MRKRIYGLEKDKGDEDSVKNMGQANLCREGGAGSVFCHIFPASKQPFFLLNVIST